MGIQRYTANISNLVNEILDRIPQQKIINGKIFDPAIGNGQFVKEIEYRKRAAGKSNDEISDTVFGMELDRLLIDNAVNRNNLSGQYKVGNINSFGEIGMKFDVVIGNPPYQETDDDGNRKDNASNLWSKFWSKSFDICKDDGVIAYITPTTWINPSADLKGKYTRFGHNRLWDIFNMYSSYANVKDVSKHFPNVGSSFGYVIVDRSGNNGLSFSDGADTSIGFCTTSGFELVSKELSKTGNINEKFKVNQSNKPTLRVSIPLTRHVTPDNIEILNGPGQPTSGNEKPGNYIYVYVDTHEQANMVKQRLIECMDILNKHCRWVGYLNIQIVKMIKLP